MDYKSSFALGSLIGTVIVLALTIFFIYCEWRIYEKCGKPGWACIVPIYNYYVLFEIVTGNGLNMLWMFVPFVNIYFAVKVDIGLAHELGRSTLFGILLIFFPYIMLPILAFTD